MASIASLPFVIETKAECPVLLYGKNKHRPKLSFLKHTPKKSVNFGVFNAGISMRLKPVRATSGDSASGDEPEDALQATIEKSKKVLAMQRDLLQQVMIISALHFC